MSPHNLRTYTSRGDEIGLCQSCGKRFDDTAAWFVTCADCRPSGIAVEPHPLIGTRATRVDHVDGEHVSGRIVIVDSDENGGAMIGLDVDQKRERGFGGRSTWAARYYELEASEL